MAASEGSPEFLENAKMIQQLGETEDILESPINLDLRKMAAIRLSPLAWGHFDSPPKKLKITNTGQTAVLSAIWDRGWPEISGGPFSDEYIFSQIHFHWGQTDMDGSEHTMDGESMPMEFHLVYFKSSYGSLDAALRYVDGVTVLVYLGKLQAGPNPFLKVVVDSLGAITTASSSIRLETSGLGFVKPLFSQNYILYWGSVQMPNFSYTVLWLIGREPIGLSTEQVAEFRKLRDRKDRPLLSNRRRPVNEKNGGHVFHVSPKGQTYSTLMAIPRNDKEEVS